MEKKLCNKCGILKNVSEFPKRAVNRDGLDTLCKECRNKVNLDYRERNISRVHESRKIYYHKNVEKMRLEKMKYYQSHIDKKREYDVEYRKTNRDKIRNYQKEWCKNSISYRISHNLRRRVIHVLKDGYKSDHTMNLVGCKIHDLMAHLESLFDNEMSWDNYGTKGWHIDHIRPCSSFDLTDPEQQKECFNYKNMQPLWWQDNLNKGSKWKKE